jgi:hypothetical protein
MASATTSTAHVLHALRICGFAPTDRVADYLRLPTGAVEDALWACAADGLAKHRTGRMTGWLLTPAGREVHDGHIVSRLGDRSWQRPVLAGYTEFLGRNHELKGICTAWQLRPSPDGSTDINDHSDPGYDRDVIDDLSSLDDRAVSMLELLADGLPRFADYRPRLASALARVRDGDTAAFATPMSASYHCIWMELHQDLLVTLGRERSDADGH